MTEEQLQMALAEDDYTLVISVSNPTRSEKVDFYYVINVSIGLAYLYLFIDNKPYIALLDMTDLLMDTTKVENDVVDGIIDIVIKKSAPYSVKKVEVTNIVF